MRLSYACAAYVCAQSFAFAVKMFKRQVNLARQEGDETDWARVFCDSTQVKKIRVICV